MAGYTISPRARRDLDQIYEYVAVTNQNPTAADRLLDLIIEKFSRLAKMPLIGQACDHLQPGLRRFVVRKYVIYYYTDDDGIWVERVLHGSRDADRVFRNNGA